MAKTTSSATKKTRKKATTKKAAKKSTAKKATAAKAAASPTPAAPTGEPVITAKTPPKPRRTRSTKAAEPAKIEAQQQASIPTQLNPEDGRAGAADPAATLDHGAVATRAYDIWVRKGRPYGQDVQNWREAELELLAERQQPAM